MRADKAGDRPQRGERPNRDGRGERARRGGPMGEAAGNRAEIREMLMIEIPRSYQRIHQDRQAQMSDFAERLGLDAAGEERLRNAIRQAGQDGGDRRAALRELAKDFTPEQREVFREIMRERRGDRAGGDGARRGGPDGERPRRGRRARPTDSDTE